MCELNCQSLQRKCIVNACKRERERVCVSIEREELGSSFFLPQLLNIRATYKIRSAAGSIETALSEARKIGLYGGRRDRENFSGRASVQPISMDRKADGDDASAA